MNINKENPTQRICLLIIKFPKNVKPCFHRNNTKTIEERNVAMFIRKSKVKWKNEKNSKFGLTSAFSLNRKRKTIMAIMKLTTPGTR